MTLIREMEDAAFPAQPILPQTDPTLSEWLGGLQRKTQAKKRC